MTNIKKAREYAGLSQKEVSISLNVSAPTVSEWESGKKNPSVIYLKELSKLYGVSTDYLLGLSNHVDSLIGHEKEPAAKGAELTAQEHDLISAYRSASPEDRAIIDNIVHRYTHEAETSRLA